MFFSERRNRYDHINTENETEEIRNNCHQSIIISWVAIVVNVATLVINVVFG